MDKRVVESPKLSDEDIALLLRIEAGIAITSDVSRADILLCTRHNTDSFLVACHGLPHSISSLYRHNAEGRILSSEEQPLIQRALQSGSGGRRQREVVRSGAPVIQEVYPISNGSGTVIAAFVVETTMIAHERQRRRDRHFQQAVTYITEMCARGELDSAARLTRFGLYDGVYLVERSRTVTYMSGIAANMFRGIGVAAVLHDQPLNELEVTDRDMVDEVFASGKCEEDLYEGEDGRTWIRRALPLRAPESVYVVPAWMPEWMPEWVPDWLPSWMTEWRLRQGLTSRKPVLPARESGQSAAASVSDAHGQKPIEYVLVLMSNATEAVAKQRELNVKAALVQEVHHRVKNNLQNIAAILRMQARRAKSEETQVMLTDAVNRVLSMSVIHEYLSQGDSRSINVRDVCARIAAQVKEVALTPDQQIEIRVQGANIRLPASQATPTALVINELLLNALEHGIKDHAQGIITLTLEDLGDAVRLEVSDDGAGLPAGFQPSQASHLGLQIVHTLVTDDLKGSITYASGGRTGGDSSAEAARPEPERTGTRAVVTFPKRPVSAE